VDTGAVLAEAVENGVTFVPGDGFYADGRGTSSMRLAFCYAEPEAITEGIRRLGEVLEDRLEVYRAFVVAGALPDEGAGGPAPVAAGATRGEQS
jgi:2-aminoadipate transaminase